MERDAKGRFIKGNTEGKNSPFCNGLASEMQAKSVEARKQNRTVAEVLRAQLAEKAAEGQSMTRLEYLTLKAINTHAKGEMTMRDLREMQKVLGEDETKETATIQLIIGTEAAAAADKWSK
jgi:hypothetical protein